MSAVKAVFGVRITALMAALVALLLVVSAPLKADLPKGAEQVSADEFTLNFREVEIATLVEAVSRITGRNFVLDPRVRGEVTAVSARPMDADSLYSVFLSILDVHGFAAIPVGQVVKIVPDAAARYQAGDEGSDEPDHSAADRMQSTVVRLRHVPAQPLLTVLRQLMPEQAGLSVSQESNALVLTDRAGNIERLKRIIDEVDRPLREVQTIELAHARAEEVVEILDALMADQSASGEGEAIRPAFVADSRTNSVLIGGNRAAVTQMRAVIADLDVVDEQEGNVRVIRLQHASAEDVVAVLGSMFAKPESSGESQVVGRREVEIAADSSLNALVVSAPRHRFEEIQATVAALDVRRNQVLVEAVIAEVSDDFTQKLGTQFFVGGGSGTVPIGVSTFDGLLSGIASAARDSGGELSGEALGLALVSGLGDGGNLGVGRFGGSTDFGVLVSALAGQAGNNILSTPSLLTLDNQEASIVVGQNIPIITGSFSQTGDGNSPTNPFQTISREDIGIKLNVTPSISPDGAVRMILEQEVSSLDTTTEAAAGFVTNKRNVTTTVQVDDGDVVVLGGLIDNATRDTRQKVPGLGDIPLFGNLFRYRDTRTSKRNLMIFIRPIVVRAKEDLDQFTRSQYERTRRAQESYYDDASLTRGEHWFLLPDMEGFVHNEPLPLPDNIEQMLEEDRKQRWESVR